MRGWCECRASIRAAARFARSLPEPVDVVAGAVHRHDLVVAARVDGMHGDTADQSALQRAHVVHRLDAARNKLSHLTHCAVTAVVEHQNFAMGLHRLQADSKV